MHNKETSKQIFFLSTVNKKQLKQMMNKDRSLVIADLIITFDNGRFLVLPFKIYHRCLHELG